MNPMEYFFHGMAGHAFHPTFFRTTANETRQHRVPTPIPWYTPPPAPTPKFHHWRGGISDTVDEFIFIVMVSTSVLICCGLILIWFRVRKSECDFQHVHPLRDTEDGMEAAPEEMHHFIEEPSTEGPSVASESQTSLRLRRKKEEGEEEFVVGEDSDDDSVYPSPVNALKARSFNQDTIAVTMSFYSTSYFPRPDNSTTLLTCFLAITSVVLFLAIVIIIVFVHKRIRKSVYDDVYAAVQDAAAARKEAGISSNQDGEQSSTHTVV
ncbi:hypothetical protein FLONG3_1669 [Fusarium longipes]|uniref:Uncharacterized protein n=1 Tax=Fusarium longipes TaxID=694270 RepID=A0A395T7E5_9HYPO|nr:hypothetical protein FLONG3_1669 [Fusarium longipes]